MTDRFGPPFARMGMVIQAPVQVCDGRNQYNPGWARPGIRSEKELANDDRTMGQSPRSDQKDDRAE